MPDNANRAVVAAPLAIGVLGALILGGDLPSRSVPAEHSAVMQNLADMGEKEKVLVAEHCPYGLPGLDNLLVRPGYVSSYRPAWKIPEWVAYHIKPDYLNTPEREGKFKSFRTDKQVPLAVRDSNYTNTGYARGHMAPYGIMGGDRDKDGQYASNEDEDEYLTVFSANLMSNIAPQWHDGFNGNAGLWYNLERWIQKSLVQEGQQEAWIIAGSVVTTETPRRISSKKILVPDMFYKIVTIEADDGPQALCFLFPHLKLKRHNLVQYLVSIDYLEALTGLDFFAEDDRFDVIYERTSSKQRFDEHFKERYRLNLLGVR